MRIRFDRGTLVLEAEHAGEDPRRIPGAAWDEERRAWRVPADHHDSLIGQLADAGVRISDETHWASINGDWTTPVLRWYQREALERWEAHRQRGVIALPTGSGKTVVALAAIARLAVATLVLVPTRVLLDQWARALSACWPHPIGRLGDGDHQVLPITVSTYASAVIWAQRIGDRFGLVVIDEAHHVGAWCPVEILEMLVAPARLGLTATPPENSGVLVQHVGHVVYARQPEELIGDGLAPYVLETIPIVLTREERQRYREHRARFSSVYGPFIRAAPDTSWSEFVRAARQTRTGREALSSWRAYRSLLAYPAGKRDALTELLARHRGERTLVFTADNATAYAIARELLVTPITHEIIRTERARALERFHSGEISVLVSSQVLDEGIDVPDADIAIVVGGSASRRRHVQRIGRVLRPRDGKRARIYELAVEETTEVGYVQRRHTSADATIGGAP
ncbi:MAG: DEAD/DEAH box helicase [Deltaproteobacteria bacterium]|nr:DEAD/DEAH box helicase [Deltaproteobacteria bacterium]